MTAVSSPRSATGEPAWRGSYVDRVTAGGASFVIPLGQRYQAAVSV